MKLYHCPQTRSSRAVWMLEECGADYEMEIVKIMEGEKPAHFLKENPMGKVPALVDEGVVITESAAICAYLADKFPEKKLAPAIGDPKRGAYYRWLFFMAGVMEPAFIQKAMGWKAERQGMVGWGDFDRMLNTLKTEIPEEGWLVTDHFTAADLLVGGTLVFLSQSGLFEIWPAAEAYGARCTDRPAMKRAQEKDAG
ncbi:MAG: glutathione S-transferase family protein [Euryhalocaulis sp.]|uniref:glutathione S-transferase family protein n=1 Tax=Euryhalocaulis sp. TaxID=2744307 RepID=UPI00181B1A8E|nr:glutathione S-transferase family protein [Euryhalocaulis sp.]MBA4802588.1 glutathione S-transferase family protein [Euryhalocaulis sp.]